MTNRSERPYALIALDVDGTLLTDGHELTEGTREAVRAAGLHGAEIMLCTGRGPAGALLIMEQLGLGGTIITHNGAATVDSGDRSIVHQFDFPQEQLEPFIAYCQTHNVHYDLNTAFDLYIFQEIEQEGLDLYAKYGVVPIILEPGERVPGNIVKMTVFGDPITIDELEMVWRTWGTDLQIIRSGESFIDVQHAAANKGSALEQYALKNGITQANIMAVGNYYNDIGMLQYAGLGVAMANSPDAVKEAADAQTLSNAEDGVKHALERYVIGVGAEN